MRDSFWIYHTTHWLLSSTTYLEEITFVCRVVCIYSEQEKYMHTGNIHLEEFGKMNSNVSQCHSGNDCSGITTTLQSPVVFSEAAGKACCSAKQPVPMKPILCAWISCTDIFFYYCCTLQHHIPMNIQAKLHFETNKMTKICALRKQIKF